MVCSKTIRLFFLHATFILLLFSVTACRHNNSQAIAKHYTEAIFDKVPTIIKAQGREKAFTFIDSVYATFPKVSLADKYRYYKFKAEMYNIGFDARFSAERTGDSAVKYLNSSIDIIEDNDLQEDMYNEYVSVLFLKANYLMHIWQYNAAINILSKSRQICKKKGDYCAMSDVTATVAAVYYQQAKYLQALAFYNAALPELETCKGDALDIFFRKQGLLDNAALCYTRAGLPDSAILLYNRALAYIEKNENATRHTNIPNFPEVAKAVVYGNMAQALVNKKDYVGAEKYFKQSIAIIDSNNAAGYTRESNKITLIQLAELYANTGRTNEMYTLLIRADTAYNDNDINVKLRWLRAIGQYYEIKNDWSKANYYLGHFVRQQDSLTKSRQLQGNTDVVSVFEFDDKEYKLKILENNAKISQFYIQASIGFVLVSLVVSSLFYYNWKSSGVAIRRQTILNRKIKQRQSQLNGLVEDLKEQSEQKERIMRVIAHDLRSPISNIMTSSTMLFEGNLISEDDFVKYGKLACSDSLRLVNEILTMSENNEEIILDKKTVEINSVVEDAVVLMKISAGKKHQQILFIPSGKAVMLSADPEMIRRVINNLIVNAIKFSNEGKKIRVSVTDIDDYVQIAIEDEGIGMSVKEESDAINLAGVAQKDGTRGEKSFGLGLGICKKIMEAHGGRLYFKSELNVGTTFYIEIRK